MKKLILLIVLTLLVLSCNNKSDCKIIRENYSAYKRYYEQKNYALALTSVNNILNANHRLLCYNYSCILQKISDVELHNIKADIFFFQKKYNDAIKEYNLSIKLNERVYNPNQFVVSYWERGYNKYNLGDNRGAINDCNIAEDTLVKYQKIIGKTEVVFLYSNIKRIKGNSFFKMKKYDLALLEYEWIVKNNPEMFADIYTNKGIIEYTSLLLIDEACLDFSKAGELGDQKAYDYIKQYCNQ
jgi:tetratricopeptide (TPR) repeat protein